MILQVSPITCKCLYYLPLTPTLTKAFLMVWNVQSVRLFACVLLSTAVAAFVPFLLSRFSIQQVNAGGLPLSANSIQPNWRTNSWLWNLVVTFKSLALDCSNDGLPSAIFHYFQQISLFNFWQWQSPGKDQQKCVEQSKHWMRSILKTATPRGATWRSWPDWTNSRTSFCSAGHQKCFRMSSGLVLICGCSTLS